MSWPLVVAFGLSLLPVMFFGWLAAGAPGARRYEQPKPDYRMKTTTTTSDTAPQP
jgi:hypothetical protein